LLNISVCYLKRHFIRRSQNLYITCVSLSANRSWYFFWLWKGTNIKL